jgi:hypothetical protein
MRRRSITIGARTFVIDSTPETTLQLADGQLDGETDLHAAIIRIRDDLDDTQWDETLLHETLHIVWHLTPLPHLLDEHEETVIRSLSPWLHTVLRLRTDR